MLKQYILYLFSLIIFFFLLPSLSPCLAKQNIQNPHWTGRHCTECHIAGKIPQRRYNGDVIQICTRCHNEKSTAGQELHPVNIILPNEMKKNIPGDWPLNDTTITCLTCHAVRLQMFKNSAQMIKNKNFLRTYRENTVFDFCFACHQSDQYQKINPHLQINEKGVIKKAACLFCHKEVPDPLKNRKTALETLKTRQSALCMGCHANLKKSHIDHTTYSLHASKDENITAKEQNRDGRTQSHLPLIDGIIHCATCHNPHQSGILPEGTSALGAGTRYFLRTENISDFCISCHKDTLGEVKPQRTRHSKRDSYSLFEKSSQHKPWTQKKCKACHWITVNRRKRPKALSLCLRNGCHGGEQFEGKYTHKVSVLANCYICHESHSSKYKKLLKTDEKLTCLGCHPVFAKTNNGSRSNYLQKGNHDRYIAYFAGTGIETESNCIFCHFSKHRDKIAKLSLNLCINCHRMIQHITNRIIDASSGINVHNKTYTCTVCHNPHTGNYQYHLKKPLKEYKTSCSLHKQMKRVKSIE